MAWEQGAFCVSVSGKGAGGGAPTSLLGPCPEAVDSETRPELGSQSSHAAHTAAFLCVQALGVYLGPVAAASVLP